jgi:hypothetical protein
VDIQGLTLEELREKAAVVAEIKADLETIEEHLDSMDTLSAIKDTAATLVGQLNDIASHNVFDDVDNLLESTNQIAANLEAIESNDIDVNDLLENTNQIVANLNTIQSAK